MEETGRISSIEKKGEGKGEFVGLLNHRVTALWGFNQGIIMQSSKIRPLGGWGF